MYLFPLAVDVIIGWTLCTAIYFQFQSHYLYLFLYEEKRSYNPYTLSCIILSFSSIEYLMVLVLFGFISLQSLSISILSELFLPVIIRIFSLLMMLYRP